MPRTASTNPPTQSVLVSWDSDDNEIRETIEASTDAQLVYYSAESRNNIRKLLAYLAGTRQQYLEYHFAPTDMAANIKIEEVAALKAHGFPYFGVMARRSITLQAGESLPLADYVGEEYFADEGLPDDTSHYSIRGKVKRYVDESRDDVRYYEIFKDARYVRNFSAFLNHSGAAKHLFFGLVQDCTDIAVHMINRGNTPYTIQAGEQLLINYYEDTHEYNNFNAIYLNKLDNRYPLTHWSERAPDKYEVRVIVDNPNLFSQLGIQTEQRTGMALYTPTSIALQDAEYVNYPILLCVCECKESNSYAMLEEKHQERITPLMLSTLTGNVVEVKRLLDLGADTDSQIRHSGITALHICMKVMRHNPEVYRRCIEQLIEHNADPFLKDKDKFSPVFYAIQAGDVEAFLSLVSAQRYEDVGDHLTGYIYYSSKEHYAIVLDFFLQNTRDPNNTRLQPYLNNVIEELCLDVDKSNKRDYSTQDRHPLCSKLITLLKQVSTNYCNLHWIYANLTLNFLDNLNHEKHNDLKKLYEHMHKPSCHPKAIATMEKRPSLLYYNRIHDQHGVIYSPYAWAVRCGFLSLVQKVGDIGEKRKSFTLKKPELVVSAFHMTILHDQHHVLSTLFAYLSDPQWLIASQVLIIAAKRNSLNTLQSLMTYEDVRKAMSGQVAKALFTAGKAGHNDIVDVIISHYGWDYCWDMCAKHVESRTHTSSSQFFQGDNELSNQLFTLGLYHLHQELTNYNEFFDQAQSWNTIESIRHLEALTAFCGTLETHKPESSDLNAVLDYCKKKIDLLHKHYKIIQQCDLTKTQMTQSNQLGEWNAHRDRIDITMIALTTVPSETALTSFQKHEEARFLRECVMTTDYHFGDYLWIHALLHMPEVEADFNRYLQALTQRIALYPQDEFAPLKDRLQLLNLVTSLYNAIRESAITIDELNSQLQLLNSLNTSGVTTDHHTELLWAQYCKTHCYLLAYQKHKGTETQLNTIRTWFKNATTLHCSINIPNGLSQLPLCQTVNTLLQSLSTTTTISSTKRRSSDSADNAEPNSDKVKRLRRPEETADNNNSAQTFSL